MSVASDSKMVFVEAPIRFYVFQWNRIYHRRIGPFSNKDAANRWMDAYGIIYPRVDMTIQVLTPEKILQSPQFIPILSSGVKNSIELPPVGSLYYAMLLDADNVVLHGPFFTADSATEWGNTLPNANNGKTASTIYIRYLSRTQLINPVANIDHIIQKVLPF